MEQQSFVKPPVLIPGEALLFQANICGFVVLELEEIGIRSGRALPYVEETCESNKQTQKNLNFNKSIMETSLPMALRLFDTSVQRVGTYEYVKAFVVLQS
jgi:hypothetical protein